MTIFPDFFCEWDSKPTNPSTIHIKNDILATKCSHANRQMVIHTAIFYCFTFFDVFEIYNEPSLLFIHTIHIFLSLFESCVVVWFLLYFCSHFIII
jgi:hypothetical protein